MRHSHLRDPGLLTTRSVLRIGAIAFDATSAFPFHVTLDAAYADFLAAEPEAGDGRDRRRARTGRPGATARGRAHVRHRLGLVGLQAGGRGRRDRDGPARLAPDAAALGTLRPRRHARARAVRAGAGGRRALLQPAPLPARPIADDAPAGPGVGRHRPLRARGRGRGRRDLPGHLGRGQDHAGAAARRPARPEGAQRRPGRPSPRGPGLSCLRHALAGRGRLRGQPGPAARGHRLHREARGGAVPAHHPQRSDPSPGPRWRRCRGTTGKPDRASSTAWPTCVAACRPGGWASPRTLRPWTPCERWLPVARSRLASSPAGQPRVPKSGSAV